MTTAQIIELVVAAAIIVAGILVYRRGGTQGGVLLLVVGLLVAIHGLGLMEYRPSASELTNV
jgi:hypothetical protein